ncbi:MAG: hypothetical protein EOP47_15740 [Sphingobacteriaceae bacterium]|nr:MAG: hypothetical protein EOP47_15740 [Sphingobacteriaceae bacterium]
MLDEYINVIKPAMIHVGHDEWRVEKETCSLCRGKDYGLLYAGDLNKIHAYLAKKGIKTAIWGDHLLESVTLKGFQEWTSITGYKYKIPGALTPQQVIKLIPKDILIFNWFFTDKNNDKQLADLGFKQVYGNLHPLINEWDARAKTTGVLGGAPSSWAASTAFNISKDLLFDMLGSANLLWSKQYLTLGQLALMIEPWVDDIATHLSGKTLPSDDGAKVVPLPISSQFNSALNKGTDSLNATFVQGTVKVGNKYFNLVSAVSGNYRSLAVKKNSTDKEQSAAKSIIVNKDVSSVLFLHATAKEGYNMKGYKAIYNFEDTAELLGWYEIVFEDGFIETVPIRYGVNISDWNLEKRLRTGPVTEDTNTYAYAAPAIQVSSDKDNPATFFAFEWKNSRFGKKIKEIYLRPAISRKKENAIVLLAVSITENTVVAAAEGEEAH